MRRQVVVGARRLLSYRRLPERFSSLATALKVFHEQNDHFVVPRAFQVPQESPPNTTDSPWPEETLGLSLGQELREFVAASGFSSSTELLKTRRQLDAVGFPQVRDWKRFQWEQGAFSALKRYKEINGDLLVPRKFVVPREDHQWPRATWGMNLGARVNSVRQKRDKLQEYQVQDLDAIGFVWVVADYTWDVLFMPALRRYRELYGNCEVPQVFVVGEGGDGETAADKWPEELQGYGLGRMVNRIRAASVFAEYMERDRKELKELGFYLNSNDQKWQETILPAFETFNRIHGNCNIHKFFTVPEKEPWPPSTWGIRLGFIAQNIRNRGDYFRQVARDFDRLEEIGFVWNVSAAKWKYSMMPALTTYVQEHGNANVPPDFVVPEEDLWPEATRGLKLGELATNPTRRKQFADFIEIDRMQLEALGFFWSALPSNDGDGDDDDELWS